jgi:hypothetical protein
MHISFAVFVQYLRISVSTTILYCSAMHFGTAVPSSGVHVSFSCYIACTLLKMITAKTLTKINLNLRLSFRCRCVCCLALFLLWSLYCQCFVCDVKVLFPNVNGGRVVG